MPMTTGETTTAGLRDGARTGRTVSLDRAARLLGVSRRTVYNRIRSGHLRTIRTIGGSQRVLIESVETLNQHFFSE